MGLSQQMIALERANRVRTIRAQIKRELAAEPDLGAALRSVMGHIMGPPPHLEAMIVETLLRACRGFGPKRARRTLALLHISSTRTLGGLCVDERVALIIELDQVVRRWEAQRESARRRRLAETSGVAA